MLDDWVFNQVDIDKSKVIWVRQIDQATERNLLNYYKKRKVWMVQPDCSPPRIAPYSASDLRAVDGTLASRH